MSGTKTPGPPQLPKRWQPMDRTGLIEAARAWADQNMEIHDKRTDLAQSLRAAAFYRADALYEFAAHIEDGFFDAARPAQPPPTETEREMSEKVEVRELLIGMESVAENSGRHVGSVGEAALLSIAVSMKRIADALEGTDRNVGARDALCMIADRMPVR